MQDRQILQILVMVIVFVVLLSAGCSSTKPDAAPASPVSSPAQGPGASGQPSQIVVKNTGTMDIHAWVSSGSNAWGGTPGDHINPGGSETLSIPADASGGTTQHFICMGRSEKVLTCREITPASVSASGILVWDGTNLNAAS
jgi:hypothetical protein